MRAEKRDAKIADAMLNRPKKPRAKIRGRVPRPQASGIPWGGRRHDATSFGRHTSMPKENSGACINPKRRANRKVATEFQAKHGRRMNPKDWKWRKRAERVAALPPLTDAYIAEEIANA